jgi:hypothetical protein
VICSWLLEECVPCLMMCYVVDEHDQRLALVFAYECFVALTLCMLLPSVHLNALLWLCDYDYDYDVIACAVHR